MPERTPTESSQSEHGGWAMPDTETGGEVCKLGAEDVRWERAKDRGRSTEIKETSS